MCEMILVVLLSMRIAKICRSKGRTPVGWVILFIGFWIAGELGGAVIGVLISQGELGGSAYVCALLGAALGAIIGFVIVSSLPNIAREHDDYDRKENGSRRRGRDEGYGEKFDEFRQRERRQDWDKDKDDSGHIRLE